jgi:hypothetical protein
MCVNVLLEIPHGLLQLMDLAIFGSCSFVEGIQLFLLDLAPLKKIVVSLSGSVHYIGRHGWSHGFRIDFSHHRLLFCWICLATPQSAELLTHCLQSPFLLLASGTQAGIGSL